MLYENPYIYTSEDVLLTAFAIRKEIPKNETEKAKHILFSKGQLCFRASSLTKRFGWGIHNNAEIKIAVFVEKMEKYQEFVVEVSIKKVRTMRSKRG